MEKLKNSYYEIRQAAENLCYRLQITRHRGVKSLGQKTLKSKKRKRQAKSRHTSQQNFHDSRNIS